MDRHLFVERAVMEESAYGSRKELAAVDLLFEGGVGDKVLSQRWKTTFGKQIRSRASVHGGETTA